jgi:HEAT repeat protein
VEERVVLGLEARLRDDESSLREEAAASLGLLRLTDAVDSLGAALADPSKDVRLQAVESLAQIGGDAAGAQLVSALMEPTRQIQGEAIDSLGRIGYLPAAPHLLTIYDAEQGKEMGDRALTALALMGAPEARGVFLQTMTSTSAARRRWAVEGLGRLRDENLKRSLTKDFLREPEPTVQLAYCLGLTLIGRPEFIDRIALSLSDPLLRKQAFGYLVELGSPFLTDLVPYLSDPVPNVRKGMALALEEVGDPDAIPYLRPLLSDPDRNVADWANRAIISLERIRMTEPVNSSP